MPPLRLRRFHTMESASLGPTMEWPVDGLERLVVHDGSYSNASIALLACAGMDQVGRHNASWHDKNSMMALSHPWRSGWPHCGVELP